MSNNIKELLKGKGLLAELEGCRNEEEAIKVLKRENLWGIINYPELEELKESYKNGEIEADGTLSLSQLDRVAGGTKLAKGEHKNKVGALKPELFNRLQAQLQEHPGEERDVFSDFFEIEADKLDNEDVEKFMKEVEKRKAREQENPVEEPAPVVETLQKEAPVEEVVEEAPAEKPPVKQDSEELVKNKNEEMKEEPLVEDEKPAEEPVSVVGTSKEETPVEKALAEEVEEKNPDNKGTIMEAYEGENENAVESWDAREMTEANEDDLKEKSKGSSVDIEIKKDTDETVKSSENKQDAKFSIDSSSSDLGYMKETEEIEDLGQTDRRLEMRLRPNSQGPHMISFNERTSHETTPNVTEIFKEREPSKRIIDIEKMEEIELHQNAAKMQNVFTSPKEDDKTPANPVMFGREKDTEAENRQTFSRNVQGKRKLKKPESEDAYRMRSVNKKGAIDPDSREYFSEEEIAKELYDLSAEEAKIVKTMLDLYEEFDVETRKMILDMSGFRPITDPKKKAAVEACFKFLQEERRKNLESTTQRGSTVAPIKGKDAKSEESKVTQEPVKENVEEAPVEESPAEEVEEKVEEENKNAVEQPMDAKVEMNPVQNEEKLEETQEDEELEKIQKEFGSIEEFERHKITLEIMMCLRDFLHNKVPENLANLIKKDLAKEKYTGSFLIDLWKDKEELKATREKALIEEDVKKEDVTEEDVKREEARRIALVIRLLPLEHLRWLLDKINYREKEIPDNLDLYQLSPVDRTVFYLKALVSETEEFFTKEEIDKLKIAYTEEYVTIVGCEWALVPDGLKILLHDMGTTYFEHNSDIPANIDAIYDFASGRFYCAEVTKIPGTTYIIPKYHKSTEWYWSILESRVRDMAAQLRQNNESRSNYIDKEGFPIPNSAKIIIIPGRSERIETLGNIKDIVNESAPSKYFKDLNVQNYITVLLLGKLEMPECPLILNDGSSMSRYELADYIARYIYKQTETFPFAILFAMNLENLRCIHVNYLNKSKSMIGYKNVVELSNFSSYEFIDKLNRKNSSNYCNNPEFQKAMESTTEQFVSMDKTTERWTLNERDNKPLDELIKDIKEHVEKGNYRIAGMVLDILNITVWYGTGKMFDIFKESTVLAQLESSIRQHGAVVHTEEAEKQEAEIFAQIQTSMMYKQATKAMPIIAKHMPLIFMSALSAMYSGFDSGLGGYLRLFNGIQFDRREIINDILFKLSQMSISEEYRKNCWRNRDAIDKLEKHFREIFIKARDEYYKKYSYTDEFFEEQKMERMIAAVAKKLQERHDGLSISLIDNIDDIQNKLLRDFILKDAARAAGAKVKEDKALSRFFEKEADYVVRFLKYNSQDKKGYGYIDNLFQHCTTIDIGYTDYQDKSPLCRVENHIQQLLFRNVPLRPINEVITVYTEENIKIYELELERDRICKGNWDDVPNEFKILFHKLGITRFVIYPGEFFSKYPEYIAVYNHVEDTLLVSKSSDMTESLLRGIQESNPCPMQLRVDSLDDNGELKPESTPYFLFKSDGSFEKRMDSDIRLDLSYLDNID